jgi:hypothetical protein
VNANRTNTKNGIASAMRETAEQTVQRFKAASRPLFDLVGGAASAVASKLVKVNDPKPVDAPPVKLPVRATAAELGIRAKGRATEKAIGQDVDKQRTYLLGRHAGEVAEFSTRRDARTQAELEVEEAEQEGAAFMERVPAWRRWMLSRRTGRAMRLVPWALWLADTSIMARPWGVYGSVPVPFVHPSTSISSATSLLRAAMVSFGLIFGVRLAGNRLRDSIERLRVRDERIGLFADALIIGVLLFFAVKLAMSTAQMQAAMIAVVTGGTTVTVPTSALFSIVAFLMAVSLACGYFLNESEIDQAKANDERVAAKRDARAAAVSAENGKRGEVRGIREQLRGLDRQEQLLVAEQAAHNEEEVFLLKEANTPLYGVDLAHELDRDDAATSLNGNKSGASNGKRRKTNGMRDA